MGNKNAMFLLQYAVFLGINQINTLYTIRPARNPAAAHQGARFEMLAPILLKRLLILLPSNVAPPAIARAMKMINSAYSVAVAPRSSRQNR
jgi:hypothetical protein